MNIFLLSKDPVEAARSHCDKHVVKMPTEAAQMLFTAARYMGYQCSDGYRSTHHRHPCTVWAGKNTANWSWLFKHAKALGAEYTARYGKVHKATEVLQLLPYSLQQEAEVAPPPIWFAQAMPDEYKVPNDPVLAYRTYYLREKARFATWKNGAPDWWHTGLLLQAA